MASNDTSLSVPQSNTQDVLETVEPPIFKTPVHIPIYPSMQSSVDLASDTQSITSTYGNEYTYNASRNTLEFLTDDEGNLFLNDLPHTLSSLSTMGPSTTSLVRTNTRDSIRSFMSFDSLKPRFWHPGVREGVTMSLTHFCDLVIRHESLKAVSILSVDCYSERTNLGVLHRFLIFHLRRPRRPDVWLRLDRRRDANSSLLKTAIAGGKTNANDEAQISDQKSHLVRGTAKKPENSLFFRSPPNLGIFRSFLLIFCDELLEYHVWPENCWFLCSLLQEHLSETGAGFYQSGQLIHPDLASDIRKRIHERVYHAGTIERTNCPTQCRFRIRTRATAFPETVLTIIGQSTLGQGCFLGSAMITDDFGKVSMQPCLLDRWQDPCCLVPYNGTVVTHRGRYTILRIIEGMEWVSASDGILPEGRNPVEGGYEVDGRKLYHAADIGIRFAGRTAPHLGGAEFVFWNSQYRFYKDYKILCWKSSFSEGSEPFFTE